jgi:hypothetical protein
MLIRTSAALLLLAAAGNLWSDEAREISWDELIPAGSAALLAPEGEISADSSAVPLAGGVVEALNGQAVRIPGFIVPLESDDGGLLAEFFLVPYFGACIHVPPPPPNQIVYVTVDPAFNLQSMWEPFWIEGTIRTQGHASVIGTTAYSLTAGKIEPYEY